MAGWDCYIANMQAMPGVEEAAIYGIENGVCSKWAASSKCCVTDDEVKTFCLDENAMRSKGVHAEGKKCILLRCEKNDKTTTLQMKSMKKQEDDKPCNITVCKTGKVAVIVKGKPDATGGQVSSAACKYGEYLQSAGY